MGALNTARGMGSPMMMVNSMVDNKASMGDTKGSPASGGEKENWLFECKACLASFKREKYLREHKRNCQPNIIKRTLQVNPLYACIESLLCRTMILSIIIII